MAVGASLTAVTETVKVWGALVSIPPLAVPPSSCNITVTTATPFAFAAGVNESVPVGEIAGGLEKRVGLSLETMKFKIWPTSDGLPGLIEVAQPAY